jgi:signal peptidase II
MIGRGVGVAIAVVVVDQVSKYAVLHDLFDKPACASDSQTVTFFLDLVSVCNRGMSFGLFDTGPGLSVPLFTIAAAAIVGVLVWWLLRVQSPALAGAIGMIIGGAVGNVIDRLHFGGVVDFLYFHLGTWYWPAFNLADSAICVGVFLMLFDGLLVRRRAPSVTTRDDPLS